jgi:hypothetical protein
MSKYNPLRGRGYSERRRIMEHEVGGEIDTDPKGIEHMKMNMARRQKALW